MRWIRSTAVAALCALAFPALFAACRDSGQLDTSPGVSLRLAEERARRVTNLVYGLSLRIPESIDQPIPGTMSVSFDLQDAHRPLALDFDVTAAHVGSVNAAGSPVEFEFVNGHIVVPAASLVDGPNEITVEFEAGDGSLNRNEEFLYTLFVPERARRAVPVFDQPDLKARYELTLEVPPEWKAVANGPLLETTSLDDGGTRFEFGQTQPISTYLFAFAAGRFEVEEAVRAGRTLRMYHRDTDEEKVARNLDAIFDLHGTALNWLEEYTGIAYPFDKFDFVAVPSFQYGGMEHPGSILYRASSLFLDESATQNQKLGRASLIAHETAHMWFGDLVTMRWFNDVWMKEVFANFMAAKIVNPSFPEVDHDLRFLLAHYPGAYAIDRTEGANPIRQELDNLAEAGTLYGAIIYQKAPIIMRHLELLVGEESLRDGLREYLAAYSFSNAGWPGLIEILDRRSPDDLAEWSRVWVEEHGRPTVEMEVELQVEDRDDVEERPATRLTLRQTDSWNRGLLWNQKLQVLFGSPPGSDAAEKGVAAVQMDRPQVRLEGVLDGNLGAYILANGQGVGYGYFQLTETTRGYLIGRLPEIEEPMTRAVAWLSLWDEMLEGKVAPSAILDLLARWLEEEEVELLVSEALGDLRTVYWRFLDHAARQEAAARLEPLLWSRMESAANPSLKATYFRAYQSIAQGSEAVERLHAVWSGDLTVPGLTLSENDLTGLAQALAVREVTDWEAVLDAQAERIQNPDRRERFEFVRPALSADPAAREAFFDSLADLANRSHEPWVLEALSYLHHPLRAAASERYITPGLEMLEEIQRTGDIFFPKRWLDSTLGGHRTEAASLMVRDFLEARPDYPARLRGKILQSADMLFRAARLESARQEP